ncbi:MAG: hypothetical protein FWC78_04115 [Defluviitaleaceae bacterium]|nr:hypothetical protein [Defluviitaleaceae bacterium]
MPLELQHARTARTRNAVRKWSLASPSVMAGCRGSAPTLIKEMELGFAKRNGRVWGQRPYFNGGL